MPKTHYRTRITEVTGEELARWGVKGLLLDVDNTLTKHNSLEVPETVAAWLDRRRAEGIALRIVSNARGSRVAPFADKVGIPFTSCAAKPLPFGLWRAVREMGLSRRECLVIGDQIFTDIWGARLGGLSAVQLDPIEWETGHRFLLFKRRLEAPIRARQSRKEGLK